MKTLIIATSGKPPNWEIEIANHRRYKLEYLELSRELAAPYMDYDPPGIHDRKSIRKSEEALRFDFYWAWQIANKVKKEEYDAVVTFSERVSVPLAHLLPQQVKHVAILINVFSRKWRSIIKTLQPHKRWDAVVAYSQAEAQALQKVFDIPSEKIHVILNYVDIDFFQPQLAAPPSQNEPFVLSQGLAKRDYPTLIAAMRQLPEIDCHISATSAWDSHKAGYESLAIPPNVHIKSYNHPYVIRESIDKCRLMVISILPQIGQWCTGSTSVLQAQAMGKPVIVTAIPGICEYVQDGRTGFLVEGQNPTDMAEKINYLWRHPQESQAMGRQGQNWVRQNFSLDCWLQQMTDLLTSFA